MGVVAALLVAAMIGVLVGVLVTSIGVPASNPGMFSCFSLSDDSSHFFPGEVLLLQSKTEVRANGEPRIVGRSYDGGSWETVSDLDFPPVSDISNPTNGKYTVY